MVPISASISVAKFRKEICVGKIHLQPLYTPPPNRTGSAAAAAVPVIKTVYRVRNTMLCYFGESSYDKFHAFNVSI
jgi:hypothetical protein